MIKERPILMCGDMVMATLEGRKTQTRRIVKPQPTKPVGPNFDGLWSDTKDPVTRYFGCPYGQSGDRLWVKETFAPLPGAPCEAGNGVIYRATEDGKWTWKPSIFMPRWASRITLEIISVRVERLQEITEADAKAEGVESRICGSANGYPVKGYRTGFVYIWQEINTKTHPWASNPWVWVLTFKQIK